MAAAFEHATALQLLGGTFTSSAQRAIAAAAAVGGGCAFPECFVGCLVRVPRAALGGEGLSVPKAARQSEFVVALVVGAVEPIPQRVADADTHLTLSLDAGFARGAVPARAVSSTPFDAVEHAQFTVACARAGLALPSLDALLSTVRRFSRNEEGVASGAVAPPVAASVEGEAPVADIECHRARIEKLEELTASLRRVALQLASEKRTLVTASERAREENARELQALRQRLASAERGVVEEQQRSRDRETALARQVQEARAAEAVAESRARDAARQAEMVARLKAGLETMNTSLRDSRAAAKRYSDALGRVAVRCGLAREADTAAIEGKLDELLAAAAAR